MIGKTNALTLISGGSSGTCHVTIFDYDGTILEEHNLNENDTLTLPQGPTHAGLVFDEWVATVEVVGCVITIDDSKEILVGALYHTSSGYDEIDVYVPENFSITFNSNYSGLVDWGDGVEDSSNTHTYLSEGAYTITLKASNSTFPSLFPYSNSDTNAYQRRTITCVRLSNRVTSINSNAFKNCYSLKNVSLPNTITSVGNEVFDSCESLQFIVVPNTLTTIGSRFLGYCQSLVDVVFPYPISTISGEFAYACYALKRFCIPKSVTTIGGNAFYSCSSLSEIVLPSGITSITGIFTSCNGLKKVTLPSTITSIGQTTFSNCYGLTTITLPNNLTSIGSSAFASCSSLQSISLPNTLTSVASTAFQGCHSIKTYVVPQSVTIINSSSFASNYSVTSFVFLGNISMIYSRAFYLNYICTRYDFTHCTSIPQVASDSFGSINANCKIVVPDSLYDSWITTSNWSTWASYIVKESEA